MERKTYDFKKIGINEIEIIKELFAVTESSLTFSKNSDFASHGVFDL